MDTNWNARFAFDVALRLEGSGESMQEIVDRHGYTSSQVITIMRDPVFLKRVGELREEIVSKGLTFRMKARTQAEELLTTSWMLIHSPEVSPAVKADLIKSTVKWAGLEPRPDQGVTADTGGVRITINLGPQEPKLVDVSPAMIGDDNE